MVVACEKLIITNDYELEFMKNICCFFFIFCRKKLKQNTEGKSLLLTNDLELGTYEFNISPILCFVLLMNFNNLDSVWLFIPGQTSLINSITLY